MAGMDTLQVIGLPARREILRLVWDRELSAGEIAGRFDVTFGAVSQHLGVLRDAGLVRVRVAGNHRYYQADRARLGPLAQALEAMWADSLDRLAAAVEADGDAGAGEAADPGTGGVHGRD
jgi:DNA-binding transcriptional ArsR family regulator